MSDISEELQIGTPRLFETMVEELGKQLLREEDTYRDTRRESQMPPDWDWTVWMYMAGRGTGKTYAGAHWACDKICKEGARQVALISGTSADVRDVMVMNPRSGVIALSPDHMKPKFEPSKRRVLWPNGAVATIFSAEEPERLRGPEHEAVWCDEIDAWGEKSSPVKAFDAWNNMMLGLRIGKRPQCMATSTPKPGRLMARLKKRGEELKDVAVTTGSTYDNRENLSEAFFDEVIRVYEGTRYGNQEIKGMLLEDVEGALWNRHILDMNRIKPEDVPELEAFERIVVALDPSVTFKIESDETGIVIGGKIGDLCLILADSSMKGTPLDWMRRAAIQYHAYEADCIIGEVNNGGDVIEELILSQYPNIPFKQIRASRGKALRAEPVSLLHEKGKIKLCGVFDLLEDQMCNMTTTGYAGVGSPDRLDAFVYVVTELMKPGGNFMNMLGRAGE